MHIYTQVLLFCLLFPKAAIKIKEKRSAWEDGVKSGAALSTDLDGK